MNIRTYEDGTEFTLKHFAVATVVGAAIAVPLIVLQEKNRKRKLRNIMRDSGYPQEAIDKV